MKKIISLMMAMVMAFALMIPALADDTVTTAVAGSTLVPTIAIEAPSGVTLVLNPYRMKYNGDIKQLKDSQAQILALPGVYVNKTDGDLRIEMTFTATPSTGVALKNTSQTTGTAKNVYLTVQFGLMTDKDGSAFSGTVTAKPFNQSSGATNAVLEYKKTSSADDRLLVAATDGKNANYFGFKFGGNAVPEPTTNWSSSDKVDVSVVMKPYVVAQADPNATP